MEDLSANLKSLADKSHSYQSELKAEQRRNNSRFENLIESQNKANISLKEMGSTMQTLSKEFFNSQDEFKNTISSNLANTNKEFNYTNQKVEQLENCVRILTKKLEKSYQPPNLLDLPINIKGDKDQIHIQKDLIAVQKSQVIPKHSVDSTYSNRTLKVEVEEKWKANWINLPKETTIPQSDTATSVNHN